LRVATPHPCCCSRLPASECLCRQACCPTPAMMQVDRLQHIPVVSMLLDIPFVRGLVLGVLPGERGR
jgi:hypothetical protein